MDRINAAAGGVRRGVGEAVAQRGAVVVFVVLTLMLIVLIVAYIVWRLSRRNLRAVNLVRSPRRLHNRGAYLVPASRLPALSVGQSYSFSMWLYLTDVQATSMHKMLVMRAGASSAASMQPAEVLASANPVVFMDRAVNRMYICVRTNRPRGTPAATLDHLLAKADSPANWSHLVATIDYVPLQRWVNVAFSVHENLLTVFVDGSIYTVENLQDMPPLSNGARPMFASCTGDVMVGNPSTNLSGDANGFIARVQFFNYALSISNSKSVYGSGPTSSPEVMRLLGVPDYGVRSPIYRRDSDDDSADADADKHTSD